MDPVTVKFVQLILAELFGAGICVAGIWVTFKGISGRMDLLVEGKGLKGKLTNASPGFLLTALGVFLITWSLKSTVKQETTETQGEVPNKDQPVEPSLYNHWLSNASKLTGDEPIDQVMTTLVGPNSAANAVVMTIRPDKDMTLAQIAAAEYGEEKYWPLLALLNRHLSKPITGQTTVGMNKGVRVVKKSKFHGFERKTVLEIKREDKQRTLDELLALAQKTKSVEEVGLVELMMEYKKKEIYLAMTLLKPSGGVSNLGELSLQLYGDKKYLLLIVWANRQTYPGNVTEQTVIPDKTELQVITIMD